MRRVVAPSFPQPLFFHTADRVARFALGSLVADGDTPMQAWIDGPGVVVAATMDQQLMRPLFGAFTHIRCDFHRMPQLSDTPHTHPPSARPPFLHSLAHATAESHHGQTAGRRGSARCRYG